MLSAIIGLVFLIDPMSGEMGQTSAAFQSKEQCEAVSEAFIAQAKDQGFDGRYICIDVNDMKSVHDGDA